MALSLENNLGSCYRSATHKAVRIKYLVCHFSSTRVDVFISAVQMVFGSALTLETFILVVMVASLNLWDHSFFRK